MRGAWRLVLLCLVALAIPLKGVAAVARVACGPMHHAAGTLKLQLHHAEAGAPVASQPIPDHWSPPRDREFGAMHPHTGHDAAPAAREHEHRHEHEHGHDSLHGLSTMSGQPAASTATESSGPAHDVKCSSGAPCCAVAATAPDALRLSALSAADDGATFRSLRYIGVVAKVPHRPPRQPLG